MHRSLLLLVVAACHGTAPAEAPPPRAEPPAFHEAWLDRSVDPCDDFYQYACGGWRAQTPIPADHPSWDSAFSPAWEQSLATVHAILEDAAAGKLDAANPVAGKLGDFYAACMDTAAAETASFATLQRELSDIDKIRTPADLARVIAAMHMATLDEDIPLFGFGPSQDDKDATETIGSADQNGLTLPDRDYYVSDTPANATTLASLRAYVADMLALAGEPRAQADADAGQVLAIETALARAEMSHVERRDPAHTYHRIDRAGLAALAPAFDWTTYFAGIGLSDLTAINVITPEFFAHGVEPLVQPARIGELLPYLRWHAIGRAAPLLGKKFEDRVFAFRSGLIGIKQLEPRWKRCVWLIEGVMAEPVGRSYVARAFGPVQKAGARAMIERIEAAFEADLGELTWMDAATKDRAREKLHLIANKVGYPDRWRDYSGLAIDRAAPLQDLIAAATFESKYQLGLIGKPIDRGQMNIPAYAADANYSPALNEMNFPAGIMQPPFFSADAAAAANYGAIGMVVGHELTHGFDDAGRKHDGRGNVADWWTTASGAQYEQRAACVAKQYSSYPVLDDLKLDGALTLGENIADNGGLALALRAFHQVQPPTPETDRAFFLAFAQVWCTNQRPELTKLLVKIDEHSARQWRVNGSVTNVPGFQTAFACKAGSKLAPVDRCTLW